MINCIFYSMFFALFLNVSLGSLRFSQINRCFLSIFKGMLEASVVTIDEQGEPVVPYFDKENIDTFVTDYLGKNIKRYSNEYVVKTTLMDKETGIVCEDNCQKLSINLKAKISSFIDYDKTQTFVIKSESEL